VRAGGKSADDATVFSVLRALAVARAGEWSGAAQKIVLDYDRRHRRRMRFVTLEGREILLDLAEAVHIRDGDAMVLEDGSFVAVRAADEDLVEVRAGSSDEMARLAWHLGNRHLAVQFLPGALRILYDHVIADMILGLGGKAERVVAKFDPESGAYAH
jgi:urease accessory protein